MGFSVRPAIREDAAAIIWNIYKTNPLALRFYEGLGARPIKDETFMCLDI